MSDYQIFCEQHTTEYVERVCSLITCKKQPLQCWQCTVDDVEHSKSHRQYIIKLSDFISKVEQDYIEYNDKLLKEKNDSPGEIVILIEDENLNINRYRDNVQVQKDLIREELQNISKQFENYCLEIADNFDEQLDKQSQIFEQQYQCKFSLVNLLQEFISKFDERYGLGEVPTQEMISTTISQFENPSQINQYLLKLKQDLIPKANLFRDGNFMQMYQKLRNKVDKPILFRKNDFFESQLNDLCKKLKQESESVKQLFQRALGNPVILEADQSTLIAQSPNRLNQHDDQSQLSFQSNPVYIQNDLNQSINNQNQEKKLFNITLQQKVKTGHTKSINCLIVINNDLIATGSKDKLIKIYKTYSYEHIATLEGHVDTVCALGIAINTQQNKTFLISGGGNFDSSLVVWNIEQKQAVHSIKGHQSSVTCIVDLEDDYHVASGSYDNQIIIWNYQSGKASFVLKKHGAMISSLKVFQDQQYLASASWDKSIVLWKLQHDNNRKIINCHYERSVIEDYAILSLGVSKVDNHLLYYSGTSKLIKIYNINTGKKEPGFDGSQYGVNEVQILEKDPFQVNQAQGCYILGLSSNIYSLRIWDSGSGQLVGVVKDSDTLVMNNFNTTPKMNIISNLDDEIKLAVINSSDQNNFFTIWSLGNIDQQ